VVEGRSNSDEVWPSFAPKAFVAYELPINDLSFSQKSS